MSYSWPGNIRELGTVIDRAAILGDGKTLEIAKALGTGALLSPFVEVAAGHTADAAGQASQAAGPIATLDAAMREHIERALAATRGRIEGRYGAAVLLESIPTRCAPACANWASTGAASAAPGRVRAGWEDRCALFAGW